jgi:hypothetical protein
LLDSGGLRIIIISAYLESPEGGCVDKPRDVLSKEASEYLDETTELTDHKNRQTTLEISIALYGALLKMLEENPGCVLLLGNPKTGQIVAGLKMPGEKCCSSEKECGGCDGDCESKSEDGPEDKGKKDERPN